MKSAAVAAILLVLILVPPALSQTLNEASRRSGCLSSPETRDLFVANKLVQPARVMREAAKAAQAEAIDIELCRAGPAGTLVYDITLLDRAGRLIHRLVTASNGAAIEGEPPGPATGAIPKGFPDQRPPSIFYSGPRPGPNGFPGPRSGPNGFAGPRFGPNGLPGPRPGERGPGAME